MPLASAHRLYPVIRKLVGRGIEDAWKVEKGGERHVLGVLARRIGARRAHEDDTIAPTLSEQDVEASPGPERSNSMEVRDEAFREVALGTGEVVLDCLSGRGRIAVQHL